MRPLMRVCVIAAGAALITGCTSFVPKPSPRVAEVTEGYYKDGTLIPHGFAGNGLVSAVQGNSQAEEFALKHRRLLVGGFALDMTALALAGAGLGTTLGDTDPNAQIGGAALLAGAGVVVLVGICLQIAAVPDKLDAINAYNDGVANRVRGSVVPAPAAETPKARDHLGLTDKGFAIYEILVAPADASTLDGSTRELAKLFDDALRLQVARGDVNELRRIVKRRLRSAGFPVAKVDSLGEVVVDVMSRP